MTNVVKGAGRRKHEANQRHQQRTPLPPRGSKAGSEARAIVNEAIREQVDKNKSAKAGQRSSKAQQLAVAAEEAGWEVERHVDGSRKTLIATRGVEQLEAHWENDKSCVPLGWHTIGEHTAKFQHVTVALKILAADPEVAVRNAEQAQAAKKAPKAVTHRSLAQGVSINIATATDEEVLAAVVGRQITWRNELSGGEIEVTAVVPEKGKQTRLVADDLTDPGTRQLTFTDADGGGFYTLRLRTLTDIGSVMDVGGHLLTNALHRAMVAANEGKKAKS